jgi:hypothetical protein
LQSNLKKSEDNNKVLKTSLDLKNKSSKFWKYTGYWISVIGLLVTLGIVVFFFLSKQQNCADDMMDF